MDTVAIYHKAISVMDRCGTRDPEKIAKALGIRIYEMDSSSLLGIYTYRWKQRLIFLNSRLEGPIRKMVVAHELGHDAEHRDLAKHGFPCSMQKTILSTRLTHLPAICCWIMMKCSS